MKVIFSFNADVLTVKSETETERIELAKFMYRAQTEGLAVGGAQSAGTTTVHFMLEHTK